MKVKVKVIPNAKENSVIEGKEGITVRTKAVADKGKANRAVVKLLSKHFGSNVNIISGEKSREKIVEIEENSVCTNKQ